MFQQMKKRIKNEKGLTLVELLAVIVILAIISAIAIPSIGNIVNNSKDRAILAEASNLLAAAKIAVTDNACKTANACSNTELAPYFEGNLDANDKVTWTGNNGRVYSIVYKGFGNLNDKTKYEVTSNTLTEAKLVEYLKK